MSMFSNLFYLSNLLELSVSLNQLEKRNIFYDAYNDSTKIIKYINTLENELYFLASESIQRNKKTNNLDNRNKKKAAIIQEVEYSKALHKNFDKIQSLECNDKD